MQMRTTDLAMEAHESWRRAQREAQEHPGIHLETMQLAGLPVQKLEIRDEAGAQALGKPRGIYYTMELEKAHLRHETQDAAKALAEVLRGVVQREGTVLVAGLGNRLVTPDALGPETVRHLLVTAHLGLNSLRPVAAFAPGVQSMTGMDSTQLVRSAAQAAGASCILAVDALAASSPDRLARVVQVTDAGITPGSGVGNARDELTERALGIPVIAIGVPLVITGAAVREALGGRARCFDDLVMADTQIDVQVRRMAWLLARAVNFALQDALTWEEMLDLMGDSIM